MAKYSAIILKMNLRTRPLSIHINNTVSGPCSDNFKAVFTAAQKKGVVYFHGSQALWFDSTRYLPIQS